LVFLLAYCETLAPVELIDLGKLVSPIICVGQFNHQNQLENRCKPNSLSGYNCLFTGIGVTVFRRSDDSIASKGLLDGQLYLVDFNDNNAELDTCLIAKTNMDWLWHRRLDHVGMKNLHKVLKGEHILGLTNVHFEKDRICSACQAGKQVGAHHPHKNIMMTDNRLNYSTWIYSARSLT
jgi:hypothetical protein